ncbi:MAG: hypothetical protein ACLP9Y_12275 [Mycobacterium sp.]
MDDRFDPIGPHVGVAEHRINADLSAVVVDVDATPAAHRMGRQRRYRMPGKPILVAIEVGSDRTCDDGRVACLERRHQQAAGCETRALVGDGQIARLRD